MRMNPDKERILLTHVYDRGINKHELEERRGEMRALIRSATGVLAAECEAPLVKKTARFYIGEGKVQELKQKADLARAVTFVFSVDLSPSQTRNLEQIFLRTVIDRTGLILDIFARRARTKEGKLQVELAQLMYLLPRLEGRGVFLSRLGGGIGTRGPGEQKLEVDRRKIRQRIGKLKEELEHVREHRARLRQNRDRKQFIHAVLVGYTNAGKSTLLNALTKSQVRTQDLLFATLDPTTRYLPLAGGRQVLLTDTVGLLADLPHDLIEAFRPTLEEIEEAEILIHVIDASHEAYARQVDAVERELKMMGVSHRPRLVVFNKMDAAPEDVRARTKEKFPDAMFVSALEGSGLPVLKKRIEDWVDREHSHPVI